jgi:hypothetical protein
LAVRTFTGQNDPRILREAIRAYEPAIEEADELSKQTMIVGYAALLAERGSLREAHRAFSRVSEANREKENLDIAVAYYYLAIGDPGRSLARLIVASERDSWRNGPPGREGQPYRSQIYRMNDFDRLRGHPMWTELVTVPEEK